jgi:hypothetical protein
MTAPATTTAAGRDNSCPSCCLRGSVMWHEDDLMVDALAGRPLPTDIIDRITPGRARLLVALCLAAGAELQDGDQALFEQAVADAERSAAGATGWWREALGMTARPATPARPRAAVFPPAAKAGNAR